MIKQPGQKTLRHITIGILLFITVVSLFLRFYHITRSEFFFYDEGFY